MVLEAREILHSDDLNGLERSATVGKNVTYGNECYTDRDSRDEVMSREAKKGYNYKKLAKKWVKHLPLRI